MDSIYVLDRNFNLLGVIDEYVSVIWRPSYSEVGDFEIYLAATSKAFGLLVKDNYVVRSSDVSVDEDDNVTYEKVMIIKNIRLITDVENGDFLTVTGRELKYLLHQRIVWQQTNLSGTAEDGIRRLVDENAINPTNVNRVIPNLTLGAAAGLTDKIEKQVTGDYLDEAIIAVCTAYNYGWEISIYNNLLLFIIYQGLDRSYDQNERPYVVFSDDFENLYNTEYELNTESYANTTLIGGEGEGLERIYTTIGDENTGLERYEVFTDVRDVSQNKDSEEEIPLETYLKLLEEKGLEKLATLLYTEGFSGEVLSDATFKYGVDFYLGDLVTVINEYGVSRNVRVMSAIESQDENGVKLIPQFNI